MTCCPSCAQNMRSKPGGVCSVYTGLCHGSRAQRPVWSEPGMPLRYGRACPNGIHWQGVPLAEYKSGQGKGEGSLSVVLLIAPTGQDIPAVEWA